jgi:dTDP-4-dehydrorhamnose reductase
MKILIFGNGQIGNLYLNYFQDNDIKAEIAKTDITNIDEVEKAIANFQPSAVINTAAKTNLEYCNKNKLEAFNVNVLGANNIARVCDRHDIHFLHISSGCIFQSVDENDEKYEDSEFDPQSYYSWTKVWAEQIIPWEKSASFKYTILRPRQPISGKLSNKNMLVKMLTFSKFVDTPNTGTVLEDMMDWTMTVIEKEATGIYHLANPGWATPYEIGEMLKEIINPDMEFEKITKEELNKLTPNTRVDTVLNVDKLKELGIEPKPYRERLREVIADLKENLDSASAEEVRKVLAKTVEESKQRTVVNEAWKNLLKD